MRLNLIKHDSFTPQYDSFLSQRLYKGVYSINDQEQSSQVLQNVATHIVDKGTYKNLNIMLHEKVAI